MYVNGMDAVFCRRAVGLLPPPPLSRPSDELFQSPTGGGGEWVAETATVPEVPASRRGHSNVFKLIVDALRVEVV